MTSGSAGASPQLEDGYLRLANELSAAIQLAAWDSGAQARMVQALIRVTYGLNRKMAPVGLAAWRALTGLSDRQIKEVRQKLHAEGVFVLERDFDARLQQPACWSLQKDYTRWRKYSVSIDAVRAAEETAATFIDGGEDQGTSSAPGAPSVPGDQVRYSSPPQVQYSYPAMPEKPLAHKGSEAPKDIERQVVVGGERAPAPEEQQPDDPERAASRIIIAANRGMRDNPAIGEAYNPIPTSHASRQVVLGWLAQAIPIDLATAAVYTAAHSFKPTGRQRQISSMRYFQNPVLAEWEREQAASSPAPPERRRSDAARSGPIGVDPPKRIAEASAQLEEQRSRAAAWMAAHAEETERIRAEAKARLSGAPFYSELLLEAEVRRTILERLDKPRPLRLVKQGSS